MSKRRLGRMDHRVTFDPPNASTDGYGNTLDGYDTDSTVAAWADLRYQRGGEGEDAGRTTGSAVFKVRIRSSAATRAITTDWRMRRVADDQHFDIEEVDAISDRGFVWIVARALTGVDL